MSDLIVLTPELTNDSDKYSYPIIFLKELITFSIPRIAGEKINFYCSTFSNI